MDKIFKSDYYYDLPEELIAQDPIKDRSSSRLMVLDKITGEIEHRHFYDIIGYLRKGDCLVLNNTKVIPARLIGVTKDTGAAIEVLLLKRKTANVWEAIVRPGKKLRPGREVVFGDGLLMGKITDVLEEGNRLIEFEYEGIFEEILDKLGEMPLPPYITHKLDDKNRYQTVYAKYEGSAAAPTAGLHFTKELLEKIKGMGLVLILSFLVLLFPAAAQDLGQFHRGLDSLDFVYEPLADKPIKLFYYIPTTGNVERMPVLISFHGAERLGINPIICWQEFAERDGFIILSPEFSRKYYNENGYQFGNVFKTRECKELNPEEKWVYSAIEPMFDFFQKETGNRVKKYSIQGHSAGGQFVHRYLLAKPDARVDIAVASNPGTWTWLSDDGSVRDYTGGTTWPYTIKGTPFDDERHIKTYLKRYMIVHTGDMDTETSGAYVPTDAVALAEGANRHERAKNYFEDMRTYARSHKFPFRWDIAIVGGVGHRGRSMVYGTSFRDANGKRIYRADKPVKTGAYSLIFGN